MPTSGFPRHTRAPREQVLTGDWIIPTELGPIEYASYGAGTPVLVLHGTSGGCERGIASVRGLASEGFRLIAPCRYGFLSTPLPRHASPEAEADTWACLLDALRITRAPVVAHAAAAATAFQLALRHPHRVPGLVLLASDVSGIATPPAVSPRPAFPLWALLRTAPGSGGHLLGLPAGLVPSLPPRERDVLEEALGGVLPGSRPVSAPALLVAAADEFYQTLPAASRALTPAPHAACAALAPGGPLRLGDGHDIWPAVGEFLWLARQGVLSAPGE